MKTGLYVHIPFCRQKCFYCDFASFAVGSYSIDHYSDAIEMEAHGYSRRKVQTVYVGGGTPTALSSGQLRRLFDMLRSWFKIGMDAEVTVEANPATFDLKKAIVLLEAGVNRVSLGIQTFDSKTLRWLGRVHSAGQAQGAYAILREAGFKNISVDLMYGWPHQTEGQLHNDLDKVLELRPEHVSLYALSIPRGTVLFKRGVKSLVPDVARGYDFVVWKRLEQAGYRHYEVSNFSREGAECEHNLHYWRAGNYIGLGVAAHSHQNGHRYENVSDVETYVRRLMRGQRCVAGEEFLSDQQRFWEAVLIGLRDSAGISIGALSRRYKVKWPDEAARELDFFVQARLLRRHAGRILPTHQGWLVLDEICARLFRWAPDEEGSFSLRKRVAKRSAGQ